MVGLCMSYVWLIYGLSPFLSFILHHKQLDAALSSGEFVGMVADDPLEKIKLKMFDAEIINDDDKLNAEVNNYRGIPAVSNVTQQQVLDNYYQVKMDIKSVDW
jgi:hypothetical protein